MARILVIDDEESIRTALRRALEMDDHEVTVAEDGEEGERLFRESPADLIIVDIIMPKKEGVEVVKDLVTDYPNIKVIMMSGGARMAEGDDLEFLLEVASSHGANKTFTKPFDLTEMMEAVRELLGESAD
jgi:DNA-binding response OmpR family regulator